MSTTAGRMYIDRRIELLVAGDTDRMVDEGYNQDAVLINLDGQVRGNTALKEYFRAHIPSLGGIRFNAIDKLSETEGAVFIELTVTTGKFGQVTSYEAFLLKGGKAQYHFTALK